MLRTAFSLVAMCALLAAGVSCDKIKDKVNVPGNISGRVLNADGSPRGYVSVLLIKEGAEVQRQNAEDSGTFFFSKVDAGEYSFKVMAGATLELPSEPITVKLGMGKTKTCEVKLLPEQAK